MWRLASPTSHGGNSVRSVFTVVAAAFITLIVAFLTTFFVTTTPVHAATDAEWSQGKLIYNKQPYQGPVNETVLTQLKLPKGTSAYTYVDPDTSTQAPQSGGSNSSNSPPRQLHVIYFAKGVDVSKATQASYQTFTVVNATTFSSASSVKSLSVDTANYGQKPNGSSCAVPGGLGWIICPVSNFLASGMDTIFAMIKGFFVVHPPTVGNNQDDMYIAWNIARSIANVVFIIVFIIITYSQISQVGISNYGLKKLLPRLIIAAILMNLSYYICAIAIDLSNILGFSVQDLFTSIRQDIFNINPGDPGSGDVWSFESVTGFILSGGTAALAAGVGIGSALLTTGGSVVGLIFLLLPVLLGLILAVLVVFVILAARQAIIIILLIISPLAFVAYLLPNTEKLFERWRSLFMTMLIFFPAFSLVFGGSQLASAIIIQNASSINLILLGLIVQVAPLVITPILLRFSGTLLGRIAGIVNNPRKGLVDRTRNWANSRVEDQKYKKFQRLENGMQSSNRFRRTMSRLDAAGRSARWLEYRKHRIEQSTARGKAQYEAYTEKRDSTTRRGQQIQIETHEAKHNAELYKKRMEQALAEMATGDKEKGLSELIRLRSEADATLLETVRSRVTSTTIEQGRITQQYEKFAMNAMHHAQETDMALRAVDSATNIAKGIQVQNFAKAVDKGVPVQYSMRNGVALDNASNIKLSSTILDADGVDQNIVMSLGEVKLSVRAGGIHVRGETRALASAQAVVEEERDKMIKMIETTSDIPAGKLGLLHEAFDKAVAENDTAAAVAYANKMAASNSAGIEVLRRSVTSAEGEGRLSGDQLVLFKQYMNANSNVNSGAEDIGSWSRDPRDRSLAKMSVDDGMWREMTPMAFSTLKKSSQLTAMLKPGAVTVEMASAILDNPNLRGNVKASVRTALEEIRANAGNPNFIPAEAIKNRDMDYENTETFSDEDLE